MPPHTVLSIARIATTGINFEKPRIVASLGFAWVRAWRARHLCAKAISKLIPFSSGQSLDMG